MSSCDKEAASDNAHGTATNLDTTSDIESVQRVFETYELLEMILLRTDNATVLRGQGVNKTWRDVIQRSESLQQKLFFKPGPVKEGWSWKDVVWNPLFLTEEVPQGAIEHGVLRRSEVEKNCVLVCPGPDLDVIFALDKPNALVCNTGVESWQRMLYFQGVPADHKMVAMATEPTFTSSWDPAVVRADLGIDGFVEKIKAAAERHRLELEEMDLEDETDSD